MVRKDEINAMIESKFDELKNVFIGKTKEIILCSIKEEMEFLGSSKKKFTRKWMRSTQQIRCCSSKSHH